VVVAAAGSGKCSFKDCVITLDAGLLAVHLAVVGLVKPARPDRAAEEPLRLAFENCLIRGHGDLVAGNPARPFGLKGENVLAALSGSFLRLTSPGDAQGAAPVEVQLNRTTTYLGGHLLLMTADRETQAVLATQVKAANCLFVSAEGNTLVRLDGPDLSGDRMSSVLPWDGSHNAYIRFQNMLEQMPPQNQKMMMGMEMRPTVFNQERWRQFAEKDAQFDLVKLPALPGRDELPRDELPRISPARFKPKTNPEQPYGADWEKLFDLLRDPK
jgi:hypothetical protein